MKKYLLYIIFLIISLMLFSCDLTEPLQYEGEEYYDNYYEESINNKEENNIKEIEQDIIDSSNTEDENINNKIIDKLEKDDIYLDKNGENKIVVAFLPKDKDDKIKDKAREIVEYFHNIKNEADLYEIENNFSDFNIKKHEIIFLGFDEANSHIEVASVSDIDYISNFPEEIINFLTNFDFSDKSVYTFSPDTVVDDTICSQGIHK